MKMIAAVKMPQPKHEKILPQPQADSAWRRHYKPMSAPPAERPDACAQFHPAIGGLMIALFKDYFRLSA